MTASKKRKRLWRTRKEVAIVKRFLKKKSGTVLPPYEWSLLWATTRGRAYLKRYHDGESLYYRARHKFIHSERPA